MSDSVEKCHRSTDRDSESFHLHDREDQAGYERQQEGLRDVCVRFAGIDWSLESLSRRAEEELSFKSTRGGFCWYSMALGDSTTILQF